MRSHDTYDTAAYRNKSIHKKKLEEILYGNKGTRQWYEGLVSGTK